MALTYALVGPVAAAPPAVTWRYIVPKPGEPFEHPPLRALALSDTKPEDVTEHVTYRGTHRSYAQLRYGSPSSVRVTIVLDEIGPFEADLYVDAGRHRAIEPSDRVKGQDLTWRVPLDLALLEGTVLTTIPRTLIVRFGSVGRILSFATAGYLEGQVAMAGRTHRVRRVDGDGNGMFTDAQDRVWIDLNDDGVWDGINEQFLYAPILTVGGTRYAVRSDPLGRRLELGPLEGTGTVRLAVKPANTTARIAELTATLIGRDGAAVSLQGADAQIIIPAGDYRLACVTLALEDPRNGPRWTFVFSDRDARPPQRWYKVAKGVTLTIDPIGVLDMRTGLEEIAAARAGQDLSFQPQLYTGDGLLIVSCVRGTYESLSGREAAHAELLLASPDGTHLASARSGFM